MRLNFLCIFNTLEQKFRGGNSIGNELFSCAPVNPRPPRPPHQSGEDLNTVIITDCIGHIFFFKIKVLFQREAQRRHCREQAGASRGLEDLPDGNKRRWLLIKGSHWWAQPLGPGPPPPPGPGLPLQRSLGARPGLSLSAPLLLLSHPQASACSCPHSSSPSGLLSSLINRN